MLPWIWLTSSAGRRHVVLDQVAALEHGDLGHALAHLDAHQVAADRPTVALAAPPLGAPARRRRRRAPGGQCRGLGSAWSRAAASARRRPRSAAPRQPCHGCGAAVLTRFDVRLASPLGSAAATRAVSVTGGRAGVADLGLAHERPLGGLGLGAALAHRLGQLGMPVGGEEPRRGRGRLVGDGVGPSIDSSPRGRRSASCGAAHRARTAAPLARRRRLTVAYRHRRGRRRRPSSIVPSPSARAEVEPAIGRRGAGGSAVRPRIRSPRCRASSIGCPFSRGAGRPPPSRRPAATWRCAGIVRDRPQASPRRSVVRGAEPRLIGPALVGPVRSDARSIEPLHPHGSMSHCRLRCRK